MSIKVITLDNTEEWDRIVKSFNNYNVFYLSGFVKAFQIHGDGEPQLIYFNNGRTRAINVIVKRDIAVDAKFKGVIEKNKYYDLSSPFGYYGFIIDGDDIEELNEQYDDFCKQNDIIAEFVRFSLFSNSIGIYSGEVEKKTHNIVRKLDIDPVEVLYDFEHKVRKNIIRANSYNLKIITDYKGEMLDDFLNVYYSTLKRNNAEQYNYFSKEFFNIINDMKENIVYFFAIHEDKIISVELVLFAEANCYSYLGGTLNEYYHMRPNDFLKYEIIKWAYDRGLKNFVLGGGYGCDDGIFNYKKSFAPNGVVDFYIGKKIYNYKKYEELMSFRRLNSEFNENTAYFPKYRG